MNIFTKENLTGENQTGKKPNLPLKYLTASTLIGEKVINAAEEKLGDVKDIMIDVVDGKIHYVVIEMGGFLGMGEKYFAIPYDMLEISTSEHAFILDQQRETLENAPGFDKDHWPDTNAHYTQSGAYWGSFMGPNTGVDPS